MSLVRLTVVGLGLVGGSVAAAAKRAMPDLPVRGVDSESASVDYARAASLIDEGASPERAEADGWFAGSPGDLVVLATPVAAAEDWLERLGRSGFTGIVTDVSSTKRTVVAAAATYGHAYRFVGGHPMAGSERSGVQAATPTLFDGAYYILTPTDATDMDAYREVHAFVTSLGARVISVDAAAHDDAVAIVSHVPHVAAAALVDLVSARAADAGADLLRLAAGGFKDMTRIAAGSPELWTGICLDNAPALAAGLEGFEKVLAEFRVAVSVGDEEAVHAWLAAAADTRRRLPAQWVPASTRLRELLVPVSDRPGVVGVVTTAVSRAGCNIEDIEIDHRSEDSAVLRLVLTDEGDADALMADLSARGFSAEIRQLEGGGG